MPLSRTPPPAQCLFRTPLVIMENPLFTAEGDAPPPETGETASTVTGTA